MDCSVACFRRRIKAEAVATHNDVGLRFTLVETSFIVRREKLRAVTRSPHRLVALAQTRSSF
jgi:hypothetical protein